MCKNISIEELYMYNCELDDSYYCDVRNLIISGNLNVLSLYKNKFSNFESILKLIHLTSTQKKGYKTGSQLINLDLSVNPIKKNSICNKYIDIFVNVCYNTTLKILDISQTLNGENPKIKNEEDENKMDIDESTKSKSSIENSELNESKRIENLNERLKDIENKDIYF
jgi:flagellar motility protein MotE (MotC chaperone)